MNQPTVEEVRQSVLDIEQQLIAGTYRPGPWARMLRRAQLLDVAGRRALTEDVTRVGDLLHRNNHPGRKAKVRTGVMLEIFLLIGAIVDVAFGVWLDSAIIVGISTFVMCQAAQPLFKMLVGTLLGVRYSYFWFWLKIEPRAKMQYGTYIPLTLSQRVILHASGMVGSAAAFLAVGYALAGIMPGIASICLGVGWFFVALNLTFFVLGLAGVRKVQKLFSGGAAAAEILKQRRLDAMRQAA